MTDLWLGTAIGTGGFCHAPPRPLLDSRRRANFLIPMPEWRSLPRMANERLPEQSIPDRSPGHAFIAIAHAGWRRHTKV